VERDPAGPCADVEHRAVLGRRELAPDGQVGGVASAFDVVPDDLDHRNDPFADPRATSSRRRSSIAVYVGSATSRPEPASRAASRGLRRWGGRGGGGAPRAPAGRGGGSNEGGGGPAGPLRRAHARGGGGGRPRWGRGGGRRGPRWAGS